MILLVLGAFDFLLDFALFNAALFIAEVIFEQEGIVGIILFIEFMLLILLVELPRRFDAEFIWAIWVIEALLVILFGMLFEMAWIFEELVWEK